MSLETSDKELTTALERLSITIEITTINNENIFTILTQKVFDAIDTIRLKKKHPELESISDHIKKTGVFEFDKNVIEKAISELVKLNLIKNKKTPQGLDSFYRTSRNEILTCQIGNLSTKRKHQQQPNDNKNINSNAEENFFQNYLTAKLL